MQIDFLVQLLKRSWWIIAVCGLMAANIALLLAYQQTPLYQTQARYLVSPGIAIEDNRDLLNSFFPLDGRALTVSYAEILQSDSIFAAAAGELQMDGETLSNYQKSAVVLPESNVLQLTVSGPDPETTAKLVNTTGQISIEYFQQLYTVYEVNILDPASIPDTPYSPTPLRDGAIAGFIGIAVGFAIAYGREILISLNKRSR